MKKLIVSLIVFGAISTAAQAFEAGHCPVGPFGTDGDTGTAQCRELSVSEICETYLLAIEDGDITDIDPAKVQFCKGRLGL